jgi:lysophospholipase L1-like esterase
MYKAHIPKIKNGDKVIIGIGDSYTQGVGAYTDTSWKKHNGKIEVFTNDSTLIAEQYEGSWVNQLCQDYFKEWVPVNLGHAGVGNRASIKQLPLYLNTKIDIENASEVIVVLMLSGLERFDFVRTDYNSTDHHSFQCMWPNPADPTSPCADLWKAYADNLYSNKFIAVELILNILEAQTYCKANGYKFIFGSAFDNRANKHWLLKTLCGLITSLEPSNKKLIDSIDWTNYIYPKGFDSFLQYLLQLEGKGNLANGGWWPYYTNLDGPSEYITNCAHPTRKGHKVIANIIYDFIKEPK